MSKQQSSKNIDIQGAKMHNLKNISLQIPHRKMVVITGLSGSGKSSLAFDTLYAEGQRRYVESLSSYARQFLGRLNKPKVDRISGIAPAIAIEQKVNSTNPRSTVGTSTEIYDYLKLLFARIGKTYSPISNEIVEKDTVQSVLEVIKQQPIGEKLLILAPINLEAHSSPEKLLSVLQQQGYARLRIDGEIVRMNSLKTHLPKEFELVVDRVVHQDDEDFYNRLADSIETAFFEGKGHLNVLLMRNEHVHSFSNLFEKDGIKFVEPSQHLFSFNNPMGACPKCEGYGDIIGIDPDLVIPNTSLSVFESTVAPWRGERMKKHKEDFIQNAYLYDFPVHKPYYKLTDFQKELVWEGKGKLKGIHDFFKKIERKNYKIQNRVMLSRYRGKTQCNGCNGKRLRPEANYVKVGTQTLTELVNLPFYELQQYFDSLILNDYDYSIAKRLLKEIRNRINFLCEVGLEYLTLNRKSNSLSGGESQRINLATSLGSSLVGSLYILDEPSIGLHPKDTQRLVKVLSKLRDLGNTVLIVEHDEEIMKASDEIIDIGPEAGVFGGEVVAQGSFKELLKSQSLTAKYLNGELKIEVPVNRRKSNYEIRIDGARHHNLKNIDVSFPLEQLVVITGVSGSGKSTLVQKILYPALEREKEIFNHKPGQFTAIQGDIDAIDHIQYIDQNPIGLSSRSNPVTYIKAYDDIRSLYAGLKGSKVRGFKTKHFSFNVDGGRCETCKGEGTTTVEMQFMADVKLTCETCNGKRFKKEVLEVCFENKNIHDLLSMSIEEAIAFFSKYQQQKIVSKLQPLQDVGMGYVALGQSSSTLSGGEAQRIKLATFLLKGNKGGKTLFIFDEPTTGLHFHDIQKLLKSFNALIDNGHSLIVIEHNIELIKSADHIIDLGPHGGDKGGELIATGTPEEIAKHPHSCIAPFLKEKLEL